MLAEGGVGMTALRVDVMRSGTIILRMEDGMAIVGIRILSADDARAIADALLKAADSVEALE
jgi:hypothetical protein